MNTRSFVFQILMRLLLILVTLLAGVYFYLHIDKLFSVVGVILLLVLQVLLLVRYCRRIDHELSNFFDSLSSDDFQSANLNSKYIQRHSNLGKSLEKYRRHLAKIKKESQIREVLLMRFLENVDTGIILFDDKDRIYWLNSTALRILGINRFDAILDLWKTYPDLSEVFSKIKPGERKIYRLNTGSDIRTLTLRKSEFKTEDKKLTLFAFDHISSEYSEIEQESWEKLIRVITHEIMNTLTPITALIQSIKKELRGHETDRKWFIESTDRSLNLIEERSRGLLEFVKKYRQVTLTPRINRRRINVAELLHNTCLLLENKEVAITIDTKPIDLILFVDKELFSQVIVNVVKNSVEALDGKENGEVRIDAYLGDDQKVRIRICDNGPGIDQELLDRVFVPFFTTKKSGSGIGLGYSRKIVRLHGGTMELQSTPGKGTVCTITL